jgi:SAM-dependent methyltransferase
VELLTALSGRLHKRYVEMRRQTVLAAHIAPLLPRGANVLDVGAGSGELASSILELRPDLSVIGVDTIVRPHSALDVRSFDGISLPFADGQFDSVMAIDVLHHALDPESLMAEMSRVSKGHLVVKDHLRHGLFSAGVLRLMDWFGNAHHGVALPFNYLTAEQWSDLCRRTGLAVVTVNHHLNLYPPPVNWIAERNLHFLAVFSPVSEGSVSPNLHSAARI